MSAAQEEFEELMREKGRRTAHPEDGNDHDSRASLDDSQDGDHAAAVYSSTPGRRRSDSDAPRPSMSSSSNARSIIPLKRYGANTGPKGVISDAQDFRDSRRNQRLSVRNLPGGLASQFRSLSVDNRALSAGRRWHDKEEEEEEEEDELDVDDDFLHQWRQSRLEELRNGSRESLTNNSHHKHNQNAWSKRHYGSVVTVDGEGYLDAVDNSGLDTVVVVYIYDDMSEISELFESFLRTIASKHHSTRFVKLHYEDAEMEGAGVPAIIAYRNGDKFAALVPIINELPDDADLSASTLEAVMQRHQILT